MKQSLVFDYEVIFIPGARTVKDISFPTQNVGYTTTDIGTYKTVDGGETCQRFIAFANSQGDRYAYLSEQIICTSIFTFYRVLI